MTRTQLAMAMNADEKWVENTVHILRLPPTFTATDVTWLGLVQLFSQAMGFTLLRSAELATEAMQHAPETREVPLGRSLLHEGSILIDIARYHSSHNTLLSAALVLGGPRRRGRPAKRRGDALSHAAKYGIDVNALRLGLNDSPAKRLERLEQNAEFVDAMRANLSSANSAEKRKKSKRKLDR